MREAEDLLVERERHLLVLGRELVPDEAAGRRRLDLGRIALVAAPEREDAAGRIGDRRRAAGRAVVHRRDQALRAGGERRLVGAVDVAHREIAHPLRRRAGRRLRVAADAVRRRCGSSRTDRCPPWASSRRSSRTASRRTARAFGMSFERCSNQTNLPGVYDMRVPLQGACRGIGRRGRALGPTRHSASARGKSQGADRKHRVASRFARVAPANAAPQNPPSPATTSSPNETLRPDRPCPLVRARRLQRAAAARRRPTRARRDRHGGRDLRREPRLRHACSGCSRAPMEYPASIRARWALTCRRSTASGARARDAAADMGRADGAQPAAHRQRGTDGGAGESAVPAQRAATRWAARASPSRSRR